MTQFIVSARKYRPQRFDEVVGQEHITTTLKNAIRQNKVAHAFLFCGPRGVGKTTTARILAKTINCENITDDFEACGQCASCVAFQKKNAANIIELDAASHNSVDDIRYLNEQVRIPPAQGNYKLFIIDEVHMLSISAFNAFLKTLEEPPPSAIFILATTEKHKILPTILSRCQIYDFKQNKVQDIVLHLEKICKAENLEYDQEALNLIGEKADGALRDALSIFDRMVSFSDGHISYEAVIDQLNVLDYDYFFQLTDMLLSGDLSSAYLLFDQILAKGFNPDVFLLGFQEHLRQLLMLHLGDAGSLVNGSPQLQQRYAGQSANASKDFLLTILDLANECDINYRLAQNKRLHVEIALMKMAYFSHAEVQVKSDDAPAVSAHVSSPAAVNPAKMVSKKNDSQGINPGSEKGHPPSDLSTDKPADHQVKQSISNKKETEAYSPASNPNLSTAPDSQHLSNETAPEKKDSIEIYPARETIQEGQVKDDTSEYAPKKRKSRRLLPTLNAMDDIIEKIEKSEGEKQVIPKEHELVDLIQNAWDNFAENHSSPSLISYLKDAQLEWRNEKLYIIVTSQLAKSSILDQRNLFEDLREATSPLIPEIVFEINPGDSAVNKPPAILTTKDKYEALKKVNPNLDHLIKELNLKIDDF